jgi:hypothetical protein
MPHLVVDLLEVIDVEHREMEETLVPARARELALEKSIR